jgi:small-conductance mechanosensitive channel
LAPRHLILPCAWVKHHWDTYYDLLENIKEALDEHHIAIPYPQMDIRVAGTVPTLS